MKEQYRFIVYSDIHYDRKSAQCITGQDCATIEAALHQRASDGGFDFTLFCGDRFQKREPEDEIKVLADRTLLSGTAFRKDCPHFHLVGNHDWTGNNRRWHTSESLKGFPGITIMDEAKTYGYNGVLIHALPAGFQPDLLKYQTDPEKLNIFVFHDIAVGSKSESGHVFSEGVSLGEIDRSEFSVIFAGDIHIPQKFNLKNTTGGYTGAVLQRTMADAMSPRGWLEVLASRSFSSWDLETVFVPTRNFFTKIEVAVDGGTKIEDCVFDVNYVVDCFVEVVLTGEKKEVDRMADEDWDLVQRYGARGVKVSRNYVLEKSERVIEMSRSNTLVDDVKTYLDSGFASIGSINQSRILEIVESLTRKG